MPRPALYNSVIIRHKLLWERSLLLQFSTRARPLGALIRDKALSNQPDVQVRDVDDAGEAVRSSVDDPRWLKTYPASKSKALSVTRMRPVCHGGRPVYQDLLDDYHL